MAERNCKCEVCGKKFHHCGSCGMNDDNFIGYDEYSYCSIECYRKSAEYVEHAPLLLRLWESLSEEQQEMFGEYLDSENGEEIDEWRSKLYLAQQSRQEDRAVEVTKEEFIENYEGFEIYRVQKRQEYPDHSLDEVLETQYYAVSPNRRIKLPQGFWSASKEYKGDKGDYNYEAPEGLHYLNTNNIYTVIDLVVKHSVSFRSDSKEVWQQGTADAVEKLKEELKPFEDDYNKALKRLEAAKQAKAVVRMDVIEEMKE